MYGVWKKTPHHTASDAKKIANPKSNRLQLPSCGTPQTATPTQIEKAKFALYV
jgi:hypothetical protein